MLSKLTSAATYGVSAFLVEIETHIEGGLFNFSVVGLPDNAVKESRERVSAAIKNSNFKFPRNRIIVNLALADIKKEGSAFDLPIAVGIISAIGQLDQSEFVNFVLVGELALDGTVRPVHGILPIAVEARDRGISSLILPKGNAKEAAMVDGINVYPVESLSETTQLLSGEYKLLEPFRVNKEEIFGQTQYYQIDFADVKGLFGELDSWIRMRLRCFLEKKKAVKHPRIKNSTFASMGLVSLEALRTDYLLLPEMGQPYRKAVYGKSVRTV